jgi:hypothetical protein
MVSLFAGVAAGQPFGDRPKIFWENALCKITSHFNWTFPKLPNCCL